MTRMPVVALLAASLLALPSAAVAGGVVATIQDQRGRPVDGALLELYPLTGNSRMQAMPQSIMDQVSETFVPHVLAVTPGTPVQFPNHDDVRHHVYSFSDVKKFELPLYKGTPAKPVVFDQPGVVVLGCNIHDWMRGYIAVTDTPYFAVSSEGKAEVSELPAGRYRVTLWHPLEKEPKSFSTEITIGDAETVSLTGELTLKPSLKVRRSPKAGGEKY